MGATVDRDRFADEEYAAFAARLRECLAVLRTVLDRPGFGVGPVTLGAELEGSLIDREGRAAPLSTGVRAALDDPRIVSELARFNIEANLAPQPCHGPALGALEAELGDVVQRIDGAARSLGGRLVTAGIVPSIELGDVGPSAVSDETRYRALENGLERLRGRPIHLAIDGPEPFVAHVRSVAVEGASTSWQLHLRVDPGRFRATYNAARMATIVALAAGGNAPFYCGHRLWDETRVALFRQAIDARGGALPAFSRVGFGDGWLRGDAYELFDFAVRHHAPIIPALSDTAPSGCPAGEPAPALDELRLHMGTVWSWNRPVYDPVDGGHLRLELRALPSGPTSADMVAGAAFLLGLTLALSVDADETVARFPFAAAQRGFYDGARRGLGAELDWPDVDGGLRRVLARDLAADLLPVAQAGLDGAGLSRSDTAPRLELLAERLRTGCTGAVWMTRRATELEADHGRVDALRRLALEYAERSAEGAPVATWPVA